MINLRLLIFKFYTESSQCQKVVQRDAIGSGLIRIYLGGRANNKQ